MKEFLTRWMVGGIVVSGFSFLGGLLRPKSFAGLFAAAPSVALATLILTVTKQGSKYASIEARSMLLGAVAFAIYAWFVGWLLIRRKLPVLLPVHPAVVSLRFRSMVRRAEAGTVRINFDTSGLGQSRWYEYFVRFAFGGAVTALAGIVAKCWGPEIGGLFLAFPAIFPATATLIQQNEKRKKERLGQNGVNRGREAAGVDAAGATIGSIGLIAFAITVWQTIPEYPLSMVLGAATLAWLITSVMVWEMWQVMRRRSRANRSVAVSAARSERDTKRVRVR